jgi:hypothetical protein
LTPEQKLKHLILIRRAELADEPAPVVTAENIDQMYDEAEENDDGNLQDARSEIRCSGVETGLGCEWSRHYESKAVAAQAPDGSWVGWTYWYGGGKHGEPDAIDWVQDAYDVACAEEQKMVTVRTFTKQ